MRILGVDPGLTRCGVGVVELLAGRKVRLVAVGVIRSDREAPTEKRLHAIAVGLDEWLDRERPDVVAVERVFAQHNVSIVMGTAQAAGLALVAAARREVPVAVHTPSEIKAAITGYGRAEKAQVQHMVSRVLGLSEIVQPPDAADALALAICHAWRGAAPMLSAAGPSSKAGPSATEAASLTPARAAWLAAEQAARRRGTGR